MKRDCVAPKQTAKIPILVASTSEFRNSCHNPKGLGQRTFATIMNLTSKLNSSRAARINRDLRQAAGNSNLNPDGAKAGDAQAARRCSGSTGIAPVSRRNAQSFKCYTAVRVQVNLVVNGILRFAARF
jgi:hypothetical protein